MNTMLDSAMSPPLNGLKVLEISAAGSFAVSLLAMILADQGADVAKVGLDAKNRPVNPEFSTAVSREERARPGIDRNKQVLQAIASGTDIGRLVELADVVILPYDTGIPDLAPHALREKYPSLVVVSLCEFDTLTSHAPRDGVAGAATGLFTDMNLYDRLFSPGTPMYHDGASSKRLRGRPRSRGGWAGAAASRQNQRWRTCHRVIGGQLFASASC